MRVAIGVGNLEVLAKLGEDLVEGHGWVVTDPASKVFKERAIGPDQPGAATGSPVSALLRL